MSGPNAFMARAIELALENVRAGRGGPFAAVVVRDNQVVACGTNLVTSTNDPTAHAEMVAIREACRALGAFQLRDCDIYTIGEPCPMCLGAIYWARAARVYYALPRADAARIGFDDAFLYEEFQRAFPERRIPLIEMMREEALPVFREWERKADRVPY
ncbi:MAG: nucleoside deaminase [Acidobacteriota bacterium]